MRKKLIKCKKILIDIINNVILVHVVLFMKCRSLLCSFSHISKAKTCKACIDLNLFLFWPDFGNLQIKEKFEICDTQKLLFCIFLFQTNWSFIKLLNNIFQTVWRQKSFSILDISIMRFKVYHVEILINESTSSLRLQL